MLYLNGNGANLLWKFENFRCEESYFTGFFFIWPSSRKNFSIYLKKTEKEQKFNIECISKLTISGTILVVSDENRVHLLNKFENLLLEERKEEHIDLGSLTNLLLMDKSLLPSNTLTLFIQLWESSIKNINLTYELNTKPLKRKYCTKWVLDVNAKTTEDASEVMHLNYIPEIFTSFCGENYKVKMMIVTENFDDREKFSARNEIMNFFQVNTNSKICMKCKLETANSNGTSLILLDSNWEEIESNLQLRLDYDNFKTLKSKKEIYYPDGHIVLNCFINFVPETYKIADIEKIEYMPKNHTSSLLSERINNYLNLLDEKIPTYKIFYTSMYKFYKEGHLCDVTLLAGKEKIQCHKVVLCAQSPVFTAMFQNDIQEKVNSTVDIQDVDGKSMRKFITALYSDILDDLTWEESLNLYIVADKYDVYVLKKRFSDILFSYISVENVFDLLELCENFQDDDLKIRVKTYFFKNLKEIIKLPEIKNFYLKKPSIVTELIQQSYSRTPYKWL